MATKPEIVLSGRDDTRAAFESVKRNILGLKSAAGGVSAALGPLLGTVGLLSTALSAVSFTRLVDGIDALNDLKDATGASIENISALEDIGARTGTTFETVSGTLVKFNKVLADAKPDSSTAETLKAIGLNAEELKRSDPAEALRQTAVALAGFADDGNKARIVQTLFGKSVKEVAPFLKDLAEQGQLNATVTTRQAEQAEKFNKELFQLQKNVKDAAREIASALIPSLNDLFKTLRDAKEESAGGSLLDGIFGTNPVARARGAADQINDQVNRAADTLERLSEAQQRAGGAGQNSLLDGRVSKARDRLDALRKQAAAASQSLKDLADVMDGGPKAPAAPEAAKPSAPDIPDPEAAKKAASEALANLRRVIDGNVKAVAAGLAATQDDLRFNEQFSQTLYSNGVQSLEKFYDDQDLARQKNLDAVRSATEAEIAERRKLLDSPLLKGADKASERQDVENQIAAARANLAVAEREFSQQSALSTVERQRAVQALRDDVAELDAQIKDLASGGTAGADLLQIAQRVREAGRLAVRGGADDGEADAQAAQLGRLLEVQRQFNAVRENLARVTGDAARAEELLLITSRENGDGLLETEGKVRDLRAQALGQLDALIGKTRELLALNPENSQLADGLKELELQAARARESMDPTKLRLDAAAGDIGSTIADGFERAVLEGGKLRDIVNDIGREITAIVTRELITKPLAEDIAGFIRGAGGKGTGQNLIGQLFGLNNPAAGQPAGDAGAAGGGIEETIRKITGLGDAATGSADVLGKIPQLAAIPATAAISALGAAAQITAANLLSIAPAGAASFAGSSGIGLLGLGGTIGGGGGFGTGANFGNLDLGMFLHKGGIAGVDGSPTRYHTGGIAGLAPDEVPAILRRGEEVLTKSDPRHRDNGAASRGPVSLTINVPQGTSRESAMQIGARAMAGLQRAQRNT